MLVGILVGLWVLGFILSQRSGQEVGSFEKWEKKQEGSFSLADENALVRTKMEALPTHPEAFTREAGTLLEPIRGKCKEAISAVRSAGEAIHKVLYEKEVELNRKIHLREARLQDVSSLIEDIDAVHRLQSRISDARAAFEAHVKSEYVGTFRPLHERHMQLEDALESRETLWSFDSATMITACFVRGQLVFIQCAENLHCLSSETGQEKWVRDIRDPQDTRQSSTPNVHDIQIVGETAYIAADTRLLVCDTASGSSRWEYDFPPTLSRSMTTGTSLEVHEGRIIVQGQKAFCVPGDGGEKTEVQGGGKPRFYSSGLFYFAESYSDEHDNRWQVRDWKALAKVYDWNELDSDLLQVNLEGSGINPWDISPHQTKNSTFFQVVYADPNTITFWWNYYVYTFTKGQKQLKRIFQGRCQAWWRGANSEDFVICLSEQGELRRWNLNESREAWTSESLCKKGYGLLDLRVRDGRLIVDVKHTNNIGTIDLYSIDLNSGKTVWHRHVEEPSRQAAYVKGDRVFLSEDNQRLIAVDVSSGTELWRRRTLESNQVVESLRDPLASHVAGLLPDGSAIWLFEAESRPYMDRGLLRCISALNGKEICALKVSSFGKHDDVRPQGSDIEQSDVVGEWLVTDALFASGSPLDPGNLNHATRVVSLKTGEKVAEYHHFRGLRDRLGDAFERHWNADSASNVYREVPPEEWESPIFTSFLPAGRDALICQSGRSVKCMSVPRVQAEDRK
ncbi:MAG: PQQ-binding-like beta-propeller repeat protein [Planctomycetota bacterium]